MTRFFSVIEALVKVCLIGLKIRISVRVMSRDLDGTQHPNQTAEILGHRT
jgi:hypothetical protein